jgi:glycine hydroxymethyltransferase
MSLDAGGHLTHGFRPNISGKMFDQRSYGVDPATGQIDYAALRSTAKEFKPLVIVGGYSAYPRKVNFRIMREIADEVGATFMVDMAHIAGLVAVGLHPSPVPFADFVTSTTHKTLRGPRGGLILCTEKWAQPIDKSVFPGIQGGPFMHVIAAKAVAFGEALQPEFKTYQQNVVANAKAMADEFERGGLRLVGGGTDTHLMLVDVSVKGLTGKATEAYLDEIGITVNKNAIPYDKQKPFVASGIRIGTPAITARGFGEDECREIAKIVCDGLADIEARTEIDTLKARVHELTGRHDVP